VTLSYAQSLDGSIAVTPGKKLVLSGKEALAFTHTLRADHDAILVGIGTVLADDPLLTVRHVAGMNPQPVILDSRLRFPPGCRLMREHPLPPWIIAESGMDPDRRKALEAAGASVITAPVDEKGRIRIAGALSRLAERGIDCLMVEGGSRIITSFLTTRLVDRVVLTVTPLFIGGVRAIVPGDSNAADVLPRLRDVRYERLGSDLVVTGFPEWESESGSIDQQK
jgi:GTP cyclohydrolase II